MAVVFRFYTFITFDDMLSLPADLFAFILVISFIMSSSITGDRKNVFECALFK